MKRLAFMFFACSMMQLSAQNSTSSSKSEATITNSVLEILTSEQVLNLTKKLNLNDVQQESVSGLVINALKSDKFQLFLGRIDRDTLLKAENNSELAEKIQNQLFLDSGFQENMALVLEVDQMKTMMRYMPK